MEMWNNKVMKGLIIIAALCSNLSETSDSLETVHDWIARFKFQYKNKAICKSLFVTSLKDHISSGKQCCSDISAQLFPL